MYAGRVASCPLASFVEYAPTEQTDGLQTVILHLPLDAASVKMRGEFGIRGKKNPGYPRDTNVLAAPWFVIVSGVSRVDV